VDAARHDDRLFASGVNASPGAAVGQVYFDADTAEKMAKEKGQDVIMVRPFTKPDDVHGMLAAKGILTSEGGATSHAAVVARQFGVPCIVGASMMSINLDKATTAIQWKNRQRRRLGLIGWQLWRSLYRQAGSDHTGSRRTNRIDDPAGLGR
jgi:phosphoenolpyruvate synthase/pyruvate phosphate dikinase